MTDLFLSLAVEALRFMLGESSLEHWILSVKTIVTDHILSLAVMVLLFLWDNLYLSHHYMLVYRHILQVSNVEKQGDTPAQEKSYNGGCISGDCYILVVLRKRTQCAKEAKCKFFVIFNDISNRTLILMKSISYFFTYTVAYTFIKSVCLDNNINVKLVGFSLGPFEKVNLSVSLRLKEIERVNHLIFGILGTMGFVLVLLSTLYLVIEFIKTVLFQCCAAIINVTLIGCLYYRKTIKGKSMRRIASVLYEKCSIDDSLNRAYLSVISEGDVEDIECSNVIWLLDLSYLLNW